MSPDGENNNFLARELAQEKHLVIVSGHYEGIDQRVRDQVVDREVSIGDYGQLMVRWQVFLLMQ